MDGLTGLPTHHDLPTLLQPLLATAAPVAGIFLDLDEFAYVNLEWGHAMGDEVLARLGAWLGDRVEAIGGSALRIGGDEFLLLLPRCGTDEARTAAEVLIAEWAALHVPYSRPEYARDHVTLSAVVFEPAPGVLDNVRAFREAAAGRLYAAEAAAGRDFGVVTTLI